MAALCLAPDGKTLASGDDKGLVELWDLPTNEELLTLKECTCQMYCLCFSPDAAALAGLSDTATGPWDVRLWLMRNDESKVLRATADSDSKEKPGNND